MLGLFTVGCGVRGTGRFADDAYYHREQPIRIVYQDASVKALVSRDWYVENYSKDEGIPERQKLANDYVTSYTIDPGDSGNYRASKAVALNDLVLEHRLHDGRIWLRAFPVSAYRGDAELVPMVRNYVDLAAGPTAVLNVKKNELTVSEQRWATRLLRLQRCSLGGKEAVMAEFDRANADQLRLWPQARTRRVRLVLVRTGYEYDLGTRHDFPSLLLVGYSNRPEDFARGVGDFESLLGTIELAAPGAEGSAPGQKGFACSESLAVEGSPSTAASPSLAASPSPPQVLPPAPAPEPAPTEQEATEPEVEPEGARPADASE